MTLDKFLKYLETTPRQWKVTASGAIRFPRWDGETALDPSCPITQRFGESAQCYDHCAGQWGLSLEDKDAIVRAADASACNYDWLLRVRLLRACGLRSLKEEKTR